ncbi:G-alpha-domain-containing protein [Guyanagaster necrorhizus]|uniref:G-alpha-domain-containing protein n=1 Tax=Guyanagaster necrorhizus TaxID=856835 RepID=A0A9P7VEY6_9AGAR|nr:G-alpha-domain-containing protein [Guyanagaster necrorhizus MCA 3950]KAG7439693.1 G-alpha-domain-containing protein [Guyanagaster necrorhizus MCA 3950]
MPSYGNSPTRGETARRVELSHLVFSPNPYGLSITEITFPATPMSKRGKANTEVFFDALDNPFYGPTNPPGPPDETEEQRTKREKESQDAQKVSRQIDEHLLETKKAMEKKKRAVKMLLLGQAESGKSTLLKNFQLAFTPIQFRKEQGIWKRIVQLNLINSIKIILDALQSEWIPDSTLPTSLGKKHRLLHLRLSPLFAYETAFNEILSLNPEARDVCVRAGSGWKSTLSGDPPRSSLDCPRGRDLLVKNDPTQVLEASVDDILSLWNDPAVQDVLHSSGIRLQDSSGFFLDDVSRVTRRDYMPTESDIVRARVRTIGVEEHHFVTESGTQKGSEFFIADVGGSRSSRPSWIPYFDDVDAILFLAPLAFNLSLEEDPRVNRLEDSLQLWRAICENKLLANCTLILFLNKKDILAKTLASGVSVKQYVTSYNDPNDVRHVTKYFKDRFRNYHRKLSLHPRSFISYETSAIDTRATQAVVLAVHDSIIRRNLAKSELI